MHLLLRFLLHMFLSRRRTRVGIYEPATLPLWVLPTDVDMNLHINNGMYLSLMDLGRVDLMIRGGAWKVFKDRKWGPVVSAETISFRRPLNLGTRYTMETRVIGTDERAIYFEQRMVQHGEILARAFVATRLVGRNGPVPLEEILDAVGHPPADLVLPEWIHEWRINNSLPSLRRGAPHVWG